MNEPRFWFGFEVPRGKLVLGRIVLFGMLALDALLQIRHAPRYGAGGFNVAQLPFLDGLGPGRAAYGVCELVNAYLFVLAAFGVATRFVVPAAAVIYAWLYFGSQLDSYQHHYLVSMILVVACFVPWESPPGRAVRSWALRLILVELGIMYLWAAISKMNHAWVDGTTLGTQIHGFARSVVEGVFGMKLGSCMVIAMELVLAATVWSQRAAWIAAPVGVLLHAMILTSGLEIGLFAWLMLGIYVLVIPDAVYRWVGERRAMETARGVGGVIAGWFEGGARWGVLVVALAAGLVLGGVCRLDHALVVGVVLTIAAIALAATRRADVARLAVAHLAAFVMWTAVDRASTVAVDYYRFWGGNARRLKDPAAAERAYRELVRIAPDEAAAHYQLGRLLLARDASDEGFAELHEAEQLDPGGSRPFLVEAQWLARHHRIAEARKKVQEAVEADPTDREAADLLHTLSSLPP